MSRFNEIIESVMKSIVNEELRVFDPSVYKPQPKWWISTMQTLISYQQGGDDLLKAKMVPGYDHLAIAATGIDAPRCLLLKKEDIFVYFYLIEMGPAEAQRAVIDMMTDVNHSLVLHDCGISEIDAFRAVMTGKTPENPVFPN